MPKRLASRTDKPVLLDAALVPPFAYGGPDCPVRATYDRIGDEWSATIISNLSTGRRGFNELRRSAPGLSQRMLTETLRRLEQDGLVSRHVTPSRPPRVDYALTDMGESFLELIGGIISWSLAHGEAMSAARKAFAVSQASRAQAASSSGISLSKPSSTEGADTV